MNDIGTARSRIPSLVSVLCGVWLLLLLASGCTGVTEEEAIMNYQTLMALTPTVTPTFTPTPRPR
ncbi:MAG: hypothetical protein HC884_15085 [Chloroflexaceae bacterium]|nr:hypothetical protein [Chloroflexaceae bacterium]